MKFSDIRQIIFKRKTKKKILDANRRKSGTKTQNVMKNIRLTKATQIMKQAQELENFMENSTQQNESANNHNAKPVANIQFQAYQAKIKKVFTTFKCDCNIIICMMRSGSLKIYFEMFKLVDAFRLSCRPFIKSQVKSLFFFMRFFLEGMWCNSGLPNPIIRNDIQHSSFKSNDSFASTKSTAIVIRICCYYHFH